MNPHLPSADPDRTAAREPSLDPAATVDASLDSTRPKRPTPPVDAPSILGYAITGEIAKGGMGRVYAGLDLTLDREVAIKTLLPGANAERFVTESKITAKLPHPNIPPVYALGTLPDASPFLAMKYVHGQTLSDQLKARPTPTHDLPRFVQIFEQIAQAVGFAHSRGVIHRDLKPGNVMLGEFGEVQVMDWGLARELAGGDSGRAVPREGPGSEHTRPLTGHGSPDPDLTAAGAIMGTPGYMAPEQARGESVDARADVFALGSVLATILTGKPAVVGASVAEKVQKAATADFADAFTRLDSCGADAELIALAERCLSADRDSRPADGRAVATEVGAYRAGVEARLRKAETDRAEAVVREGEQRKRRRVVQWAGGLIAAVLLAAAAVSVAFGVDANKQAGEARLQTKIAGEERDAKGIALEEAKQARDRARLAATEARAALDAILSDSTQSGLQTQADITPDQRKLYLELLPVYRKFAQESGDDRDSRERTAGAAMKVAKMLQRLGERAEADAAFDQSRRGYRQLWHDYPDCPRYAHGLISAGLHARANAPNGIQPRPADEECVAEACEVGERLTRRPDATAADRLFHASALREAARVKTSKGDSAGGLDTLDAASKLLAGNVDAGCRLELARLERQRSTAFTNLSRRKDATDADRRSVALYEVVCAAPDTSLPVLLEYHRTALNLVGQLDIRQKAEEDETAKLLEMVVRSAEGLAARYPSNAECLQVLGSGYFHTARVARARGYGQAVGEALDRAVKPLARAMLIDPVNVAYRFLYVAVKLDEGALFIDRKAREAAEKSLDEAQTHLDIILKDSPTHPGFAAAQRKLKDLRAKLPAAKPVDPPSKETIPPPRADK